MKYKLNRRTSITLLLFGIALTFMGLVSWLIVIRQHETPRSKLQIINQQTADGDPIFSWWIIIDKPDAMILGESQTVTVTIDAQNLDQYEEKDQELDSENSEWSPLIARPYRLALRGKSTVIRPLEVQEFGPETILPFTSTWSAEPLLRGRQPLELRFYDSPVSLDFTAPPVSDDFTLDRDRNSVFFAIAVVAPDDTVLGAIPLGPGILLLTGVLLAVSGMLLMLIRT